MFVRYPDLSERVVPIIDAVRRARQLLHSGGADENVTALIRDAIHEHWELRHGGLSHACHPRSRAARLNAHERDVLDWPIPRNHLAHQLLQLPDVDLRVPLFQRLLYEYAGFILITVDEAKRLDAARLTKALPTHWDGLDRYARYAACSIVMGEPTTYDRSRLLVILNAAPQRFYVYVLRNAKKQLFYIGKGDGMRMFAHEGEVFKKRHPVHTNWKKLNAIAQILGREEKVGYEIDSWHFDEVEALVREEKLIIKWERANPWRLCNSNGRRWRGKPGRALLAIRAKAGLGIS